MNIAAQLSVTGRVKRPTFDQEAQRALAWGFRVVELEHGRRTISEALKLVVWKLLENAADTLARLPDRERVWLTSCDRAGWPEVVHSAQELYEANLQRLVDLREQTETRLPRQAVTDPTAIPRMLTVLDWLQFVRGRRVKRDKMIVLAMAGGMSQNYAARRFMGDKTGQAAYMVKQKVVAQIAQGLRGACNLREFV